MNATEGVGWLDSPAAIDACVERLKIVKSLGLDAGLDFHGRLHKPMAKQLAKALEAHRPLGGINRLRRTVYETISRLRHDLNGIPRAEPAAADEALPHPGVAILPLVVVGVLNKALTSFIAARYGAQAGAALAGLDHPLVVQVPAVAAAAAGVPCAWWWWWRSREIMAGFSAIW